MFKNVLLVFSILAAIFMATFSVFSLEPPSQGEIEKYRQDGTLEKRLQFAKELGNYKVAPRLVQRMEAKLKGCEMAPPLGWQGMPTKGNVKILALLIDFEDYPHNTDADVVFNRLFGDGTSAPPSDSLRNFYRRSSYGQLEIGGSVLGWYTTPYPRSKVPETTGGRENLIKEALSYFENEGHDFSQYDNDGDGEIDYFIVVWTGPDNGWANFWWGYQTYFYDSSFKLDGKKLGNYSWQWEARPQSGTFSPRVVIHETGHALGLPDYYDYDDDVGPKGGVGGLDQMDGYGDHNCFSKMLLEWIEPKIVNSTEELSLLPSGENPDAAIVMPEYRYGDQFSEYFMVQYRDRSGNDATCPNDGLLIWHIDARTDAANYDFIYDNSYTEHKLLRLMEADGLEEIEQNKWADGGDYYTQGNSFSFYTTPSNARYCGLTSGFTIDNISEPSETMIFNVTAPQNLPQITSIEKLKNPFRLKINGNNIQSGAVALIGYDNVPWTSVSYQESSIILEKGNKLKKKFVKGVPTKFIIINPDGSAARGTYTR